MREILVDHARRRRALKRRCLRAVTARPDSFPSMDGNRTIDRLALHEALHDLGRLSRRQRRVVELRYLTGLSIEEAAGVLSVSAGTVRRDWGLARSFLHARLMSRG
jgi:RNA polymerase sigma factor (sigma-70 family)